MGGESDVEAAQIEVLQQLAIMSEQEMFDFFVGYLTRMYAEHPDPVDQVEPRRRLVEFLQQRAAALEAAMAKLERLSRSRSRTMRARRRAARS